MNEKKEYLVRLVGGTAVVRMPLDKLGQKYTQTEGKGGVIYLRPVKDVR